MNIDNAIKYFPITLLFFLNLKKNITVNGIIINSPSYLTNDANAASANEIKINLYLSLRNKQSEVMIKNRNGASVVPSNEFSINLGEKANTADARIARCFFKNFDIKRYNGIIVNVEIVTPMKRWTLMKSKNSLEFILEKNTDKNTGHPLLVISAHPPDGVGKLPKIDISFAYQKYPVASFVRGKSNGK